MGIKRRSHSRCRRSYAPTTTKSDFLEGEGNRDSFERNAVCRLRRILRGIERGRGYVAFSERSGVKVEADSKLPRLLRRRNLCVRIMFKPAASIGECRANHTKFFTPRRKCFPSHHLTISFTSHILSPRSSLWRCSRLHQPPTSNRTI